MAEVRVPLQAGCDRRGAAFHRAPSAPPRLDDVVRAAPVAAHGLLVRIVPAGIDGEPSRRDRAACPQSVRRQTAATPVAGTRIPVSIHDVAGARRDGELVAGGTARRVSGRAAAPAVTVCGGGYESAVTVSFVKFSM